MDKQTNYNRQTNTFQNIDNSVKKLDKYLSELDKKLEQDTRNKAEIETLANETFSLVKAELENLEKKKEELSNELKAIKKELDTYKDLGTVENEKIKQLYSIYESIDSNFKNFEDKINKKFKGFENELLNNFSNTFNEFLQDIDKDFRNIENGLKLLNNTLTSLQASINKNNEYLTYILYILVPLAITFLIMAGLKIIKMVL